MIEQAADPLAAAARLFAALSRLGVTRLALTGSAALGVWAAARQSRDLDVCGAVSPALVPKVLARFDGLAGGPPEDPRVLRLRFGDWDVDLFATTDVRTTPRATRGRCVPTRPKAPFAS
jgi:hypothetical protein